MYYYYEKIVPNMYESAMINHIIYMYVYQS